MDSNSNGLKIYQLNVVYGVQLLLSFTYFPYKFQNISVYFRTTINFNNHVFNCYNNCNNMKRLGAEEQGLELAEQKKGARRQLIGTVFLFATIIASMRIGIN